MNDPTPGVRERGSCWSCVRCGTQYPPSVQPPDACGICTDEREHISPAGQRWTGLDELREKKYRIVWEELEPGVHSLRVDPPFALGHRAILLCTPSGNLLWDPLPYLDDETITRIGRLGGLAAVSASHPHFYSCQIEWSRRFGGAPIYLAIEDRPWLFRTSDAVRFFERRANPLPDVEIARCGGHFPGASVVHWRRDRTDPGCLFVGGTIGVLEDQRHIAFMYSYANWLPLPPRDVESLLEVLRSYRYDRIHGDFHSVPRDAPRCLQAAASDYLARVEGRHPTRPRAPDDLHRS